MLLLLYIIIIKKITDCIVIESIAYIHVYYHITAVESSCQSFRCIITPEQQTLVPYFSEPDFIEEWNGEE
jgi:hypothetical protein